MTSAYSTRLKRNRRIDIAAIQDIAKAIGADPSEPLSVIVIMPEDPGFDVSIMRAEYDTSDRIKVMAVVYTGGDDHFLQRTAPEDRSLGITEVLQGGAPMLPSVAHELPLIQAVYDDGTPLASRGLSQRQLEVLSLLAKGHSYKMIGEQLQISMGTVNSHVRTVYKKLQVHSVAGAVGIALKLGLG